MGVLLFPRFKPGLYSSQSCLCIVGTRVQRQFFVTEHRGTFQCRTFYGTIYLVLPHEYERTIVSCSDCTVHILIRSDCSEQQLEALRRGDLHTFSQKIIRIWLRRRASFSKPNTVILDSRPKERSPFFTAELRQDGPQCHRRIGHHRSRKAASAVEFLPPHVQRRVTDVTQNYSILYCTPLRDRMAEGPFGRRGGYEYEVRARKGVCVP